jgi:hypothetical protein
MLGSVARRVQDLDRDVAEFQNISVSNAAKRKGCLRLGEKPIFRACGFGQLAASRDVAGMQMRIDHIMNAHSGFVSRRQIGRDLTDRIYDGSGGAPSASEEVRRSDRVGVQELAQDHG